VLDYPKQSNTKDCGIYVMSYIENWNGKHMKNFGQEYVDNQPKNVAYNLATSSLNKVESQKILNGMTKTTKKRKP